MFNTIFTKNDRIKVIESDDFKSGLVIYREVLPLSFGKGASPEWRFPIEPLISISGQNTIVKRKVAKSKFRGTVKERWSEDDYKITIQGSFVHPLPDIYPRDDVQRFMDFVRYDKAIYVFNDLFEMLDVSQIVIESFSLPFSKGENVQNYTLEAYSDNLSELFIDLNNV